MNPFADSPTLTAIADDLADEATDLDGIAQRLAEVQAALVAAVLDVEAANVRQTELQAEEFELRMQLKEALARLGVQVSL